MKEKKGKEKKRKDNKGQMHRHNGQRQGQGKRLRKAKVRVTNGGACFHCDGKRNIKSNCPQKVIDDNKKRDSKSSSLTDNVMLVSRQLGNTIRVWILQSSLAVASPLAMERDGRQWCCDDVSPWFSDESSAIFLETMFVSRTAASRRDRFG